MSKAQLEFMKEHLPTFINWMQATGQSIGIKMQPWQKRVVEAMIRNGHLKEDGSVTERGMRGYERRLSVILPRFDHQMKAEIQGKTADLIIVDDV